jgi:hypothetical protein
MILALLDGRKAMTRQIVKYPIESNGLGFDRELGDILCQCDYLPPSTMLMKVKRGRETYTVADVEGWERECPYGAVGERLWVKETFATSVGMDGKKFSGPAEWQGWPRWYRADDYEVWPGATDGGPAFVTRGKWRPSIFMTRWASRITLEVTDVRVERLLAITEEDARAEGVDPFFKRFPEIGRGQCLTTGERAADAEHRASFAVLWDELNGDRALWKSNPWVWVVGFRRVS